MLSKSIMDLICSEPSPSSPTEKFFDSERELVLGTHSQNKSLTVNDSSLSNGSSVSGHLLPVSHKSDLESHSVTNQLYELSSSPLSAHSEASSGYDSMANISPSSEGEFQLDEINFHSTNCNFDVLTEVFSTRAQFDRHLLDDIRALRQMLQIEHLYVPWGVDQLVYLCDKYETDEKARRIVTEWMLEVCEELKCEDVTFPLAVNYLDRFIKATPEIHKYQLQLVAVVCLLLASKLRQCNPLDPNDLREMTDRSVSVSQILSWETLVLNRLNWDVSSVLATDYLDHILVSLPELYAPESASCSTCCPSCSNWSYQWTASETNHHADSVRSHLQYGSAQSPPRANKRHLASSPCDQTPLCKRQRLDHSCAPTTLHETVRRHASTLVSLCSTELQFACVPPSVIAAACVASAVRCILHSSQQTHSISHTLASYSTQLQIEIDSQYIEHFVNRIESLFAHRSSKLGASKSNSASDSKSESSASSALTDSNATLSNSVLSSSKVEVHESMTHRQHLHSSTHLPHGQLLSPTHSVVHSSVHSNGHCARTSTPTGSNMVSSSSCFVANPYLVHTSFAQVTSAKQQLLVGQWSHRVQSRHLLSHNIPSASAICSRSSHSSVAHLHDASNTSVVSFLSSQASCSTFKPKLCTLNPSNMISTLVTLNPSDMLHTYHDSENQENIPVYILSGDSSTDLSIEMNRSSSTDSMSVAYPSLLSTEELPEEEDEGLQEDLYF